MHHSGTLLKILFLVMMMLRFPNARWIACKNGLSQIEVEEMNDMLLWRVNVDEQNPFTGKDTVEFIDPFEAACRGVTKSYSGHKLSLLSFRPTEIWISALERLRRSTATIDDWITCSPDTKIERRVTEEFCRRVSAVPRSRNEDEDCAHSRGYVLLQSPVNMLRQSKNYSRTLRFAQFCHQAESSSGTEDLTQKRRNDDP